MGGLDILNRPADGMNCERIRINVDDANRSLDNGWIISVGESKLKADVDIVEFQFNDMEIARDVAGVAAERHGPQQRFREICIDVRQLQFLKNGID